MMRDWLESARRIFGGWHNVDDEGTGIAFSKRISETGIELLYFRDFPRFGLILVWSICGNPSDEDLHCLARPIGLCGTIGP
jgi:hypothetical protein